ncbi:YdeI family protein [soil metagenome]
MVSKKNHKVDFYFNKDNKWKKEISQLRTIVLDCGLTEELKWGVPCYSLEKRNIVLIHVFKEYCALLFFKGAILKDPKKILIQQTKNVQAARQIRFTGVQETNKMVSVLKKYIHEAIKVEKSGVKVNLKKTDEFKMPQELQNTLDKNKSLKAAFDALTPGRQRGYILYFSAPKQSKTRESRIEKYKKHILCGKGLND